MKPGLTRTRILALLRQHDEDVRRYGVQSVALFGSYAKRARSRSSDVDFLVEFSQPSYDNFVGLTTCLEKLFGREVHILTPAGVESIRVPEVAEDIRKTLVHV